MEELNEQEFYQLIAKCEEMMSQENRADYDDPSSLPSSVVCRELAARFEAMHQLHSGVAKNKPSDILSLPFAENDLMLDNPMIFLCYDNKKGREVTYGFMIPMQVKVTYCTISQDGNTFQTPDDEIPQQYNGPHIHFMLDVSGHPDIPPGKYLCTTPLIFAQVSENHQPHQFN